MSLIGVSWPWNVVPEWVEDEGVIGPALRMILFTPNGERKMNANFGSQLLQIVFENKGRVLDALARREIMLAMADNLPFVTVRNIDIEYADGDTDPVTIIVQYEYQGAPGTAVVYVPTT